MAKHSKVLILGSGPAGYTAAIYAARAMLKPILVFGSEPGGQLTTTTDVENFPGYSKVIQGPWLMEEMKKQSLNVGTIIHNDLVTEVDFNSYPFISKTDSGLIFESKTVIISTGAQARWLGIKSEEKFNCKYGPIINVVIATNKLKNKGISTKAKGIKYLKLSSNVREFVIQDIPHK